NDVIDIHGFAQLEESPLLDFLCWQGGAHHDGWYTACSCIFLKAVIDFKPVDTWEPVIEHQEARTNCKGLLQSSLALIYNNAVIRCFFFNKLLEKLSNVSIIFDDHDDWIVYAL